MKLLYPLEHISCNLYDNKGAPAIQTLNLHPNEWWNIIGEENELIMVCSGALDVSFGELMNKRVEEGNFFLLPIGYALESKAITATKLLLFRVRMRSKLCDCFSIRDLLGSVHEVSGEDINSLMRESYTPLFLPMNEAVDVFANELVKHVENGLKCSDFFSIKLKELTFYLRMYYPKEQLLKLFQPFITHDADFTNFVLVNHTKVKNVIELAALNNYSVSAFEKKFKRVFGMSAGKWMREQRGKMVFNQISSTGIPLKDIAYDHGFSSPAHLSNFCKMQFGMTPGEIRNLTGDLSVVSRS